MEPDYRYQNRQQNFNPAPAPVQQPVEVKKKKKGCPIAVVIICLILAIGGVGFGIFEMLTINNVNQTPETPAPDEISCNCPDCIPSEENNDEEPGKTAIDPSKYIYIGEWGIKIKLPTEIPQEYVTYLFEGPRNWLDESTPKGQLKIWAEKKGAQATSEYADYLINKEGMLIVTMADTSIECEGNCESLVKISDTLTINVPHPQATNSNTEEAGKREAEIVNLLYETLHNPENYSEI